MNNNNIRCGDYEIRACYDQDQPIRYEVVKWETEEDREPYCFVIAFLEWNDHESCFELRSVGLRVLEYATPWLYKWILLWCDMVSHEITEESV